MKCYDFEFDGIRLSDKGFMICKFNGGGIDTVSNGSTITFNTVSSYGGMKHELTHSAYKEALTATFQICKHPCYNYGEEITVEEMRDIMTWLNRKGFYKLKLIDDEYVGIFFEASFNVSKIEADGKLIGFELKMETNRPFAQQEPVVVMLKDLDGGDSGIIISESDEEGYIYPNMEITINSSGDFELYNEFEDRTMRIFNCEAGEIITVDYPTITSSLGENRRSKIQNDFNWIFFRIATKFKDRNNNFTVSIPCSIEIKYTPIVKVGI